MTPRDAPRVHVEVRPAQPNELPAIESLLQLYAYDFSDVLALDVGADGRYDVPSLAPYASDPACHAYLVHADGVLAGFALVQERSALTGDAGVRDIAEFCVLRRFRRMGVGARAATWLFAQFPGPWEVRQRRENVAATAFWRGVIGRCTGGAFDDSTVDDDRWRGPVQRFIAR